MKYGLGKRQKVLIAKYQNLGLGKWSPFKTDLDSERLIVSLVSKGYLKADFTTNMVTITPRGLRIKLK